MVDETLEAEPGADWACANCGHSEAEHEEREFEGADGPRLQTYCVTCDDWHELLPATEEPTVE